MTKLKIPLIFLLYLLIGTSISSLAQVDTSMIKNVIQKEGEQVAPPDTSWVSYMTWEDSLRLHRDTLIEIIAYDSVALQTDSVKELLFPPTTNYEWISYRMKVNAEMDQDKHAFQLFFVNRIDSIIYININVIGIELIRIVATPDTVTYVNKLSYQYYKGDYTFFQAITGIDLTFNMLQSLFNAVDFAGFERDFIVDDVDSEVHLLMEYRCDTLPEKRPTCLNQRVILNHRLLPIRNMIDIPAQGRSLYIGYDNYSYSSDFPFFMTMTIDIPEENIRINGELKSLKFNTPGPTGIKIPDKFSPIDITIEKSKDDEKGED